MTRAGRCCAVFVGALLLCLAAGRGPALAQDAPDAAIGAAGAAEADLLAQLVLYSQTLSIQAMTGRLDRAAISPRLADMAGELRAGGASAVLRASILHEHRRAAEDLFAVLGQRIGAGPRWPGDRPAEVYRALAQITLLGTSALHANLVARGLDPRSALYDANLVYAWTEGRTEVTPDIDFFQRAPLDAEHALGTIDIAVPRRPAGPAKPGDDTGAVVAGGDLTGNIALGRPASQSSLSGWSQPDDARGAVDGVIDGSFGFHTNQEADPWWQVDLGALVPVGEVRIFNRLDEPSRALSLRILFSDDGQSWRTVYTHDGTPFGGADGHPLVVRPDGGTTRFVRLQLAATAYFHLDEVEIYAPGGAPEDGVPVEGAAGGVQGDGAAADTAAAYLGCFRDAGDPYGLNGRDLNGVIINDAGMTAAMCIGRCKEQGFGYAGTQYGSFCFCGATYGSLGAADNCDTGCSGNSAEICGGAWANSVYRAE